MPRAHVAPLLEVANLEKSLEFYQRLGFEPVRPGIRGSTLLDLHGARVGLAARGAVAASLGAGVVLRFTVPDLPGVHHAAERLGVATSAPAEDGSFRVVDPDGYVLEFARERKRVRPKPRRKKRRK